MQTNGPQQHAATARRLYTLQQLSDESTLCNREWTIYISEIARDTSSTLIQFEVWFPYGRLFCVGYPAILALGIMKGQTLLPSLHWIYLMPRLVYNIMILNIVSINIYYFHLARWLEWCGKVSTSFILSSWSWEIGSPPIGGAERMKLSCVVPTSVIRI